MSYDTAKWIAYIIAWVCTACSVIVTIEQVNWTGALLFLLIPACITGHFTKSYEGDESNDESDDI